jgi:hypothetical protein
MLRSWTPERNCYAEKHRSTTLQLETKHEVDVAEIAAQRRESELEVCGLEWKKLPPVLQPGEMRLTEELAVKCGLQTGTPITLDEWLELLLFSKGLPATYRSRKKDVRNFVWKVVLKKRRPN